MGFPLFLDTLRALVTPRRAVPILIVAAPLVYAQVAFGRYAAEVFLAIAMVIVFVLVGPYSWRALFPIGRELNLKPLRLLLFAAVGGTATMTVTFFLARYVGFSVTFISSIEANFVTATLFWVGGWGLGRDIELEQRTVRLEREKERAELMALRSHLDPHFLFNTLNAIAEWCREDGVVAERAVLTLSGMLRTVLRGVKDALWPLDEELTLLDTLFELHLLRDPELFDLDKEIESGLENVRVPPMILLPIAENAMKHGPSAGHRGVVSLRVRREDHALIVELENPGPFAGRREGGEGIAMVERRLALLPRPGSLLLEDLNGRTRATLRLETL